jgi:hypothetical protein
MLVFMFVLFDINNLAYTIHTVSLPHCRIFEFIIVQAEPRTNREMGGLRYN